MCPRVRARDLPVSVTAFRKVHHGPHVTPIMSRAVTGTAQNRVKGPESAYQGAIGTVVTRDCINRQGERLPQGG